MSRYAQPAYNPITRAVFSPLFSPLDTASEGAGAWSTASLYAASEPGFWLKLDPAYMYQDSAGTIPTTIETNIGKWLDISGRGNHFIQPTSPARARWTSLINMVFGTTFAGATAGSPGTTPTSWTDLYNTGSIVSLSSGVLTLSATTQRRVFSQQWTFAANTSYRMRFVVTANTGVTLWYIAYWSHGLVGATETWQANGSTVTNTSYVPVAGDVITSTFTVGATGGTVLLRLGIGCVGNITGTVGLSKVDLRLAADAALDIPEYQWVTTGAAGGYDEVGFPGHVQFDGIDDWMYSAAAVDLSGTDAVSVIVAIGKRSDAAKGIVLEHTASAEANAGWAISAPDGVSATIAGYSRGSATATASAASQTAPVNRVLSLQTDISTDTLTLRANGASIATSATDQGTGNYASATTYIGMRGGASLPFSGSIRSDIVVVGRTLTAAELANAEARAKAQARLVY